MEPVEKDDVINQELHSEPCVPTLPQASPDFEASPTWSPLSWALERVFSNASSGTKRQQKLMQMRHLHVDREILRGVPFHTVLQQPRLWLSPGLFRHTPRGTDVWNRSQKVQGFDFFISHTWRTPGRWKILSLLLQSGWIHGLLGWFVGTVLILCLEWFDIIPPFTTGSIVIGGVDYSIPSSPWVIFAGWFGMIFALCASPFLSFQSKTCFLDMTSIHQSDNELLERGIYSIGGCLSVSKELHVLYTPPYLGSLWCLFELVAFRNANPTGKIKFLPLFLERSVLVGACLVFVISMIQWGMISLVDSDFRSQNLQLLSLLIIPLVMPLVHATRNYGEKRQLVDDLRSFELEKVSCLSEFDTAFIHSAIESWYGSKEAFQDFVRGPLREELCDLLPSPHVPWIYVFFILSTTISRRLGLGLSLSKGGADLDVLLIYFLASAGYIFGWLWCSFNGLFFLCDRTCTSGKTWWLIDWLKTFVVTIGIVICFVTGEGLSIFVLRSQNVWIGVGFLVASLLLPGYIWGKRHLTACCTRFGVFPE